MVPRSSKTTPRPGDARRKAVEQPAIPPPTMTISDSITEPPMTRILPCPRPLPPRDLLGMRVRDTYGAPYASGGGPLIISAAFDYYAPTSIAEASVLLARLG